MNISAKFGSNLLVEILKIFLLETTKPIELWLCRNDHWVVLYQTCESFADRKFKMSAMTRLSLTLNPMGISHFHLFTWNHKTDLNQTWQKCSLDGHIQEFCSYWFQRRRLLNIFSIGSYVKITSSHGGHLEFPISKRFTSLVQDHPMIIPAVTIQLA
jgi:hypothetical protein